MEHHTAPGSPEGESPPGDLASTSDLLKGTRMNLWPYRDAAPSPMSAQNQRQSLARAPGGGLLLLPDDGCLYRVHHLLLHTSKRGATGTFGGLMLGRWGWGLPPHAPSMRPLVLYAMCTASPCPCRPVPTHGTATAQLPLPTGVPARWGCSLATAALGCFISTPRSSSLFPTSHQSEADCSSPVLSLQHWGGIGGDLQVLTPTAFITPSPFLRKGISHELQWKSQRSTKGVEFRV